MEEESKEVILHYVLATKNCREDLESGGHWISSGKESELDQHLLQESEELK